MDAATTISRRWRTVQHHRYTLGPACPPPSVSARGLDAHKALAAFEAASDLDGWLRRARSAAPYAFDELRVYVGRMHRSPRPAAAGREGLAAP
jgi:hypothetical protein